MIFLSKHQSGFHALHSTVTTLLEAIDSWAYNIDIGNVNAVVFLDLKKAFDTVDPHILFLNFSSNQAFMENRLYNFMNYFFYLFI